MTSVLMVGFSIGAIMGGTFAFIGFAVAHGKNLFRIMGK